MFSILLDYPSLEEEIQVVKNTTGDKTFDIQKVLNAEQIIFYQHLVRRVPVADNVLEYAVKLAGRTRPGREGSSEIINKYISWGAGPRASQNLILAAKCHAAMKGKYSPDIEDVRSVALPILTHRMFKNYKAEAEGLSIEKIIQQIL